MLGTALGERKPFALRSQQVAALVGEEGQQGSAAPLGGLKEDKETVGTFFRSGDYQFRTRESNFSVSCY